MPYMTPYASPVYFLILLVALLPAIISLLWKGRHLRIYESVLTLFFLIVSFGGDHYKQGIALIVFILWQVALTFFYSRYRLSKNQTWVFFTLVLLAIAPLALTKITPFAFGKVSIVGFLGISYLTFKAVQVLMEIRDGVLKNYSPLVFLQFLLFFPTISSGPIDRYRRFEKDLKRVITRDDYLHLLDKGVWYIFLGFFYKFILGYLFGTLLLPLVSHSALANGTFSLGTLEYMYVYSFYLFFDFAGYSLFAVGASYFLGIETPMNFNRPFISSNIKEFWNRWHMTLSFWFRDYVYMRLMFLILKKKWFKSRMIASNVGYFALFLLMGVWHGLTWYYLAYGLYHATWIVLCDSWGRFKKKHKNLPSNRFTKIFSIVATFHGVALSFLIFSGFLDKLWFR
ncbi:D-alanyl-lipoteichoic acid biosynthesis protein DltB [Enterococcus timonensis]|uniref:D-alanyl-lipoteichoic acid biosynthesis protein DltB n=1 Tax=Enterococcus timonensis TaxID=1852364 RepID=UPI0008D8F1CA|nr:D-alanyl-lipoteichoic acid biosynthesis protein DltB [Enterococcus timonensis]